MCDWEQLLQGHTTVNDLVHGGKGQLLQFAAALVVYASEFASAQPRPSNQQCTELLHVLYECAVKLRQSSRSLRDRAAAAVVMPSKQQPSKGAADVQTCLSKVTQSVEALQSIVSSAHNVSQIASGADATVLQLVTLCSNNLVQAQEDHRMASAVRSMRGTLQQQQQQQILKLQRTNSSSRKSTKVAASDRVQLRKINAAVGDVLKQVFWKCSGKQQKLLQQLYLHPLVQHHHQTCQVPQYQYSMKTTTATVEPECPVVRCSQCGMCTPSSCHIVTHTCDKQQHFKQLEWLQLQSLADSAACSPTNKGYCFLRCGRKVATGQSHRCNSLLWRLLVIDQTQLPHSNPNSRYEVAEQTYLSQIRNKGHMIVHVVFRCPPEHLPSQQWSDEQQLQMSLNNTWPLLRYLMIIGPSSYVPKQQGGFALLPLIAPDDEKVSVQADMLQQFQSRTDSSSGSSSHAKIAVAPSLTRSMTGCYTGVARKTADDNVADSCLAECKIGRYYHDPTLVGSTHVLFNLAHGAAAVLKVQHFSYPATTALLVRRSNRTSSNNSNGSSSRLLQGPVHMLLQVATAGVAGTELTWDYKASTDNPNDKLLKVECMCADCDDLVRAGKPRRKLIGYRDCAGCSAVHTSVT